MKQICLLILVSLILAAFVSADTMDVNNTIAVYILPGQFGLQPSGLPVTWYNSSNFTNTNFITTLTVSYNTTNQTIVVEPNFGGLSDALDNYFSNTNNLSENIASKVNISTERLESLETANSGAITTTQAVLANLIYSNCNFGNFSAVLMQNLNTSVLGPAADYNQLKANYNQMVLDKTNMQSSMSILSTNLDTEKSDNQTKTYIIAVLAFAVIFLLFMMNVSSTGTDWFHRLKWRSGEMVALDNTDPIIKQTLKSIVHKPQLDPALANVPTDNYDELLGDVKNDSTNKS